MPDIPAAAAVVPGTETLFFQKVAREVFCGKDQAHISEASDPKGPFPQQPAQRGKDGCASIDGEHPDGGCAFERHIPPAERIQGGEQDLHAPAGKAAFYKILEKGIQ